MTKNPFSIRRGLIHFIGLVCLGSPAGAFEFGPSVGMPSFDAGWSIGAMSLSFGTIAYNYRTSYETKDVLGARWCTVLYPGTDEYHPVELDFRAVVTKNEVTFERCGRKDEALRFDPTQRINALPHPGEDLRSLASRLGGPVKILQDGGAYAAALYATADGLEITDRASEQALKFDWNGDIVSIGKTKIVRNGGRIVALTDGNQTLALKYDGQRLSSIRSDGGHQSNVSYDPDGRVSTIYTAWIKTYRMSYLENGDVGEIVYPDRTSIAFFYGTGTRQVTGLLDRNGCYELYDMVEGVGSNNFKAQAKRRCGDRVAATRVLTFYEKDGRQGSRKKDTKDDTLAEDQTRIVGTRRD